MNKQVCKGFTLIEFLVTLVVAAILTFVAVPGFYSVMQNNRVVSTTNKLSASFNFARTEAIRLGVPVSVCPAADASLTSCGGAGDWVKGWVVFKDADGNNAVDSTNNLLKVSEALPSGLSATTTGNIVSYDASGFLRSSAFNLTLTASSWTGKNARVLSISPSGRLAISYTSC